MYKEIYGENTMAKDNDLISTLYHHGKNGPEKCPARIQCRLTNPDGSPQVHYATAEESAAAWENILDKEYQPMVSFNKKAGTSLSQQIQERSDRELCLNLVLDVDQDDLDSGDVEYLRLTPTGDGQYTVLAFDRAGNHVGRSWLSGESFAMGSVPKEFISKKHDAPTDSESDLWIDVNSVLTFDFEA